MKILKNKHITSYLLMGLIIIDFVSDRYLQFSGWFLLTGLIIFFLILVSIFYQYKYISTLKMILFLLVSSIEVSNILVRYYY